MLRSLGISTEASAPVVLSFLTVFTALYTFNSPEKKMFEQNRKGTQIDL